MKALGLLLIVVLCCALYQSNAEAVLGVADDVPGAAVVFPMICEKVPTFSGLNTVWRIAETTNTNTPGSATVTVYDKQGNAVFATSQTFSGRDVFSNSCYVLIQQMSTSQRSQLEISLGGKTHYAGYVIVKNIQTAPNQFVGWIYLTDVTKSIVAGFKPFQAEGGVDDSLRETGHEVNAHTLFPTYFLLNDYAETWNWWIVLVGTNDSDRHLVGLNCNEEETCHSFSIPIPYRLNFINVADYLDPGLHPSGFPKAGFGIYEIDSQESNPNGSVFMWSYQRECQAQRFLPRPFRPFFPRLPLWTCTAGWAVIHPADRQYLPVFE